jgi:hypothetical protein
MLLHFFNPKCIRFQRAVQRESDTSQKFGARDPDLQCNRALSFGAVTGVVPVKYARMFGEVPVTNGKVEINQFGKIRRSQKEQKELEGVPA